MSRPARYYNKLDSGKVECTLCPHYCTIADGSTGVCRVRQNNGGTLHALMYGRVSAVAVDPIEKKPLYHFYPGRKILSVGTLGCNMSCSFCQNWNISQQDSQTQQTDFEALYYLAAEHNSIGIAYTYNEPFIWYEFVYDSADFFRDKGLKNIIVSNGQVNAEPLNEIAPLIDGANIDLKGFSQDFYDWAGGDLETAKNTIETLHKSGTHVEITNLVIPGRNDDIKEFIDMCKWIESVSPDIPLHLSRYFPSYNCEEPITPVIKLESFYNEASKILKHVYLGNIDIEGTADTHCPSCGETVVTRGGLKVKLNLTESKCPYCETSLYFSL